MFVTIFLDLSGSCLMSKNRAWFLSWKLKESRWNFIKSDLNTYFNSDLVFWENNMLISRNQYTSHNERANKNASLNIDCHYVILLSLWENWTIENRFEKSLTAAWSINSPGQISLQKYFRKIWIYSMSKMAWARLRVNNKRKFWNALPTCEMTNFWSL